MKQHDPSPIVFSEWLPTGVMVHFEEGLSVFFRRNFCMSNERFGQTRYSGKMKNTPSPKTRAKSGDRIQILHDRPQCGDSSDLGNRVFKQTESLLMPARPYLPWLELFAKHPF